MNVTARSFPPLAGKAAHTLILGSMPGRESLRQQQYYAHPRNAFWPIVSRLLALPEGVGYAQRTKAFTARGFVLWDVLESCERPGSLDASIEPGSIVPNDFAAFFAHRKRIERVFFNGSTAQAMFLRHVLPNLPERFATLPMQRLPSTSPAHAGLRFDAKLAAWRAILPEGA